MKKIAADYPAAYALYKARSIRNIVDYFDSIGIRILPFYGAPGTFGINVYRKKTKAESIGDIDWKMIRVTHINSYCTRKEAVDVGIIMAFDIHEDRIKQKN